MPVRVKQYLRASVSGGLTGIFNPLFSAAGAFFMKKHPKFEQDWEKAALLACLIYGEVPPWAEGENMPKALATLCGWGDNRALNAFDEAARRGMLIKGASEENTSFAD